jgi:uncharacterized protein DUF3995
MMTVLAILLSAVVFVISAIHAYWGFGGYWPAGSPERLAKAAVGTPNVKMVPSAGACFLVAAVLAGVAAWPLFAAGLLPAVWPRWLTLLAGGGMAAAFVGRGLAGYTAAWRRRFSEEPFASLDRLAYSPLCLLLGAGYIALLI